MLDLLTAEPKFTRPACHVHCTASDVYHPPLYGVAAAAAWDRQTDGHDAVSIPSLIRGPRNNNNKW